MLHNIDNKTTRKFKNYAEFEKENNLKNPQIKYYKMQQ